MLVGVVIFLLFAFAGTFVGIDYFRERNAVLEAQIDDALT